MSHRIKLKEQVSVVIEYLEKNYNPVIEGGVIKLIYERYLNTNKVLDNETIRLAEINLAGGVRAYMDSFSDYENPLLEEMGKAEKILKQIELEAQCDH